MKNMPNHRITFDLNSPFNCSTLRKVRSLLDLLWNEMQKRERKKSNAPLSSKPGRRETLKSIFPFCRSKFFTKLGRCEQNINSMYIQN